MPNTTIHVVRRNEHLHAIADRRGVTASDIWDHPRNAALRETRQSYWFIAPGDVLHVPQTESGLALSGGGANRYRARRARMPVQFRLRSRDDRPIAAQTVRVTAQGVERSVTTDDDGRAAIELPCTVRDVLLTFEHDGERHTMLLAVRALRDLEDDAGIIERLVNLGLVPPSATDMDIGHDAIATALRTYQRGARLAETGEPDQPTRDALARDAGG